MSDKIFGMNRILNPSDSKEVHIAVLEYSLLLLKRDLKRLEKEIDKKKDK
jgi:hypothetical protein